MSDEQDNAEPKLLEDDPDLPLRLVEPEILVDSDLMENIDEAGDLAKPD